MWVNMTFTLRPDAGPPININDNIIPHGNVVKNISWYALGQKTSLGRPRIKLKRKPLNLRQLLKSKNLSLKTKLFSSTND